MKTTKLKPQGRPIKNVIQPIKDSPVWVAKAIMQDTPKKDWNYKKPKS